MSGPTSPGASLPEDVIADFPFDVLKNVAELEAEQNSVRAGRAPDVQLRPGICRHDEGRTRTLLRSARLSRLA